MPIRNPIAATFHTDIEGRNAAGPQPEAKSRHNRWVIAAAALVLCVHGGLLLASVRDWRVTIDSAYHVSLARQYGEHGLVPWDHINFGPRGRPNLQAPLMYMAIGAMGRLLGGTGNDYVLANTILAAMQWAAAMATAAVFAFWLCGEWAMLLAVAMLSGSAFAGTSFAVGIPSGWLFILTPWAIHFFLRRRLALATLLTSAAIYVHVAGYVTAPLGIFIAATLTRRWRDLLLVGFATALVTAPYTVHCLRYVGWLSGVHSYSALLFDPMLDLAGAAGAIAVLRRPRANVFLVAWMAAPIAWLFQDPGRFILQSGLAASVLGGIWLAGWIVRTRAGRRGGYAAALVAIATVFPVGVPAVGAEALWAAGIRYPRAVNWNTARTLAHTIESNGLGTHLVADYMPALCPAIAVYGPISCEKGHWVEVQPRVDPADALSASRMVYVVPLSARDPTARWIARRGWVRIWGGAANSTITTLAQRAPLNAAAMATAKIVSTEAGWLSANAVNNSFHFRNLEMIFSSAALRRGRAQLMVQRRRAGRIELVLVVYAYALEPRYPAEAMAMRRAARGFGVIASFLGDGLALDFESHAATQRLRLNLERLATAARGLGSHGPPDPAFVRALERIINGYLVTKGETFAVRPPADNLPWLSALSGSVRQRR